VCDLHENAHRNYRSIGPEGPNELARLNLFEQVTRRHREHGTCHAKVADPRGTAVHDLAVSGQLVPHNGRFRPLWPATNSDRPSERHELSEIAGGSGPVQVSGN